MYRILIVDDEPFIVEGLYSQIVSEWEDQFEVYKSSSGNQALELLKNVKFDIVISDICMPEINGLELLRYVGGYWPKCRVILLTGHESFDYAYSAIKSDACDYILKVDGYAAIHQAINKAIHQIEESIKLEKAIEESKCKIKQATSALRNEFLTKLLHSESFKITQDVFDGVELNLDVNKPITLLLGCFDDLEFEFSEHLRIGYIITGILEQVMGDNVTCVYYEVNDQYYFWLLQSKDIGGTGNGDVLLNRNESIFIKGMLENVQQLCESNLKEGIAFIVSSAPIQWENVNSSYLGLRQRMLRSRWLGKSYIITDKEDLPDEFENERYRDASSDYKNKINQMELYLESSNKNEFMSLLEEYTNGMIQYDSIHNLDAVEAYYHISLMIFSHINKCGITKKLAFKTGLWKLLKSDEHGNWIEACRYLKELAGFVFEVKSQEAYDNRNQIINNLKNYINSHYNNNLTLDCLSGIVHLNSFYLSRLFKQVEGVTITDYITKIRIREAKNLLLNKDIKIQDVGYKVGYDSGAYFTRVFKKETGLSPQQFRQNSVIS